MGLLLVLLVSAGGLRHHQVTALSPPGDVRHLHDWGRGELVGRAVGELQWRGVGVCASRPSPGSRRGRTPGPSGCQVQLTFRPLTTQIDGGDRVRLTCRLAKPQPARNPGAFDYRRFLQLQGVHAKGMALANGVVIVEPLPDLWWRQHFVEPLRTGARRALTAHLSGAAAGLLQGMLLGDKQRIPAEVREHFRGTGLAHALVISGLHVGLVALFFFVAFRLLQVSPEFNYLATTVILGVYALVTDMQPPVVRSAIMAGVIMTGRAIGRCGEVYNSLGLAALIILTCWPTALLTLSFQLSFAATVAIVGLHGPLCRCLPSRWSDESQFIGRWLVSPACVSIAAQLGTGPLIAWHFQHLAPVSLPANLLVVPLLGVCVSLGLLTVLLGSVWTPAALLFAGANYLALTGLIRLAELFAHVPAVTTPRPTLLFLLCAALAVVLATHARQNQRARATLLLLVLSWANLTLWPDLLLPRRLESVFLDVEQGDSVFLRLPDGGTMLVDAGIRSRRLDFGERVVVPYLRHHNVKRLDVVVASHPHADHIGGLVHLLEQVEVGHYVDSGQLYDTWTARRIYELLLQRGVVYHRVAAGDSLAGLGGVGGLVLHPTEAFLTDQGQSPRGLNNGSVVLQLSYGGRRILFMGDVEAETEPALQGWGQRLRADVLKAAHHGSRTSSGPLFLDAVHPGVVIISVGAFKKFGHPAAEVLQRLQQQGTRIYRTDHCGAISVAIEGDGTMQVGAVVNETCGGL